MLLNQESIPVGARYAAIFFIVTGGYMCQPTTLVCIPLHFTPPGVRANQYLKQSGVGEQQHEWPL